LRVSDWPSRCCTTGKRIACDHSSDGSATSSVLPPSSRTRGRP
jgi:hypothetical protein